MKVIYETKGRAREYCEFAINVYSGCLHGCLYCYVPLCLNKTRKEFMESRPRWEIIKILEKEVINYQGKTIFLCFTCDPYQYEKNEITTKVLQILLSNNVNVEILTKAGRRSKQDFELLKEYKENVNYGATLTFDNDELSKKYEPFAAVFSERFEVLQNAKKVGLKTWVSLEPVIVPEKALNLVDMTKDFVDEYRVGKINYFEIGFVNWGDFVKRIVEKFEKYNKKFLIKESLKKYLERGKE